MDATEFLGGGNALKAETLKEKGVKELGVSILNVVKQQFEEGSKLVLVLKGLSDGEEARLVLNITNANTLADKFGKETDNWIGQDITIQLAKTDFAGKRVDCLRIA
jgi:hypothetical protein